MSSLAQEESRSISLNVTWGWHKRFADGKPVVPFSHFLGYDRGENGELVINEEEADTVRIAGTTRRSAGSKLPRPSVTLLPPKSGSAASAGGNSKGSSRRWKACPTR